MRYVNMESVEPGQYLGRTIFSHNGTVLLNEDVQLTVSMISTLRRAGVTLLYVKDEPDEIADLPELLSTETKVAVMKRMSETMQAIRSGKDFSTRAVSVTVEQILEDVLRNKEVLVQLTDIRTQENGMFVHAMNVAMIAALMGINMGLNQIQLKELTIGALLHDVGKVELIVDDASSDAKLHHTWRGFDLLKQKRELNLLIAHVAFQHHEQPDGEGIPRGLPDEQIHLYAKIVAVANTYDNLISDTEAGRRMLPHEACERVSAMAGTKLDREAVIQFLRIVSVYPNGTSVRLSSRETGVVVGQHRGLPGRPVVRVIRTDSTDAWETKEIDLAKHHTIFIEQVLGQ